MSDYTGTTRAQTIFLRAFRANPAGPPPEQWPSPVVLRRWLKRRGFCGAMDSILRALRYQADFHLTAAAASGAHLLHAAVDAGDPTAFRKNIEALTLLLRMSHIRARFAEPLPKPPITHLDFIGMLRSVHPNAKVGETLHFIDRLMSLQERRPFTAGADAWRRAGHAPPNMTPTVTPREDEKDWSHDDDGGHDETENPRADDPDEGA